MLPLPNADVLNHQRAAARAGIAMVATIRPKRRSDYLATNLPSHFGRSGAENYRDPESSSK